jgi:dTDP-4-amino-4,6-dideoxygalactose transaminase
MLTACISELRGLRVTTPPEHIEHAYYKYYALVRPEMLRPEWTRDRIIEAMNAEGIPCFTGSCSEIYLEKAFPPEWRPAERHPVARELGETSLMFLVDPAIGPEQTARTCEVLRQVMREAAQ